MPYWATEKPVKKKEENMAYKVRRDAQNSKAPQLAGLCCDKLFLNKQLRLVGGAISHELSCLI